MTQEGALDGKTIARTAERLDASLDVFPGPRAIDFNELFRLFMLWSAFIALAKNLQVGQEAQSPEVSLTTGGKSYLIWLGGRRTA